MDRDETKQFVMYTMGNLTGGGLMDNISDEDFDAVFDMFDADKSGTVERHEMVAFIRHFLNDGNKDSQQPKVVTSRPSVVGSLSNESVSHSPPSVKNAVSLSNTLIAQPQSSAVASQNIKNMISHASS